MIVPAALLLLQLLPAPGTQSWEPLGLEQELAMTMAPGSLVREGETARLLVRVVIGPPDAPTESSVIRMVVDCRRMRFGFQAGDRYGPDGRFLDSRALAADEVEYFEMTDPTNRAAMSQLICGRPAPAPAGGN